MSEHEFWARFCISDTISIILANVEPLTSEKLSHNATYFSKEQFNTGLRFHLPFLFEQFLYFTKIPLDMLYRLELSLLEVFFVYKIKMSRK